MKTFPNMLKTWRGDRSLEAARRDLGVAWNTYRDWEDGKTFPRDREVAHLSTVLATPADDVRTAIATARASKDLPAAPAEGA